MSSTNEVWPTARFLEVQEALNGDLGRWIDEWRKSAPPGFAAPSWQTIARELWAVTNIAVSHESVRAWHGKYLSHRGESDG